MMKRSRKTARLTLTCSLLLSISITTNCNKANFRGDGNAITRPELASKEFSLGCKENGNVSEETTIAFTEDTQTTVKIKGEFCPKQTDRLAVLFIIDFSGSMGRHIPETGAAAIAGNDPQTNGSCGRLQAVSAIVEKIAAQKRSEDYAVLAMVPFASDVLMRRAIQPMSLSKFKEAMTKDTLCQYVVQDSSFGFDPTNPGGIDGNYEDTWIESSTNYKAAFETAESILSSVRGRKVVYFISDGEPTAGGNDPVQDGITAGLHLQTANSDLTLNSLLLGDPEDSTAYSVLEKIAGDASRVRVARSASDLANEIIKFPETTINGQSVKAVFKTSTGTSQDIPLAYFTQSSETKWTYETVPFQLIGNGLNSVKNEIVIQTTSLEGSTLESKLTINFTQGE